MVLARIRAPVTRRHDLHAGNVLKLRSCTNGGSDPGLQTLILLRPCRYGVPDPVPVRLDLHAGDGLQAEIVYEWRT